MAKVLHVELELMYVLLSLPAIERPVPNPKALARNKRWKMAGNAFTFTKSHPQPFTAGPVPQVDALSSKPPQQTQNVKPKVQGRPPDYT
jgi:hypothetical protein